MRIFTNEMAERMARAQRADLLRRLAKLKRLSPDAHPATNIYSPWLDYEEGDPEKVEDFYEQAVAPFASEGHRFLPTGLLGIANAIAGRWF